MLTHFIKSFQQPRPKSNFKKIVLKNNFQFCLPLKAKSAAGDEVAHFNAFQFSPAFAFK